MAHEFIDSPSADGSQRDAVQAQEYVIADDAVLKDVEKEPHQPGSELISFIKMMFRLAVNLVLWIILFGANLVIHILIGRFFGGGPQFTGGTLIIGPFQLLVLVVISTFWLIAVWFFLDTAAKKPKSRDVPRSDS